MMMQNAALIDGFLLEAAFQITRCAAASIMDVSICNVGVPLALAFGLMKDTQLDETCHRTFQELFGLNLNRYHVLSDQDLGLRAVSIRRKSQQCICLGHMLLTLKRKRFSDEVGAHTPISGTAERSDARLPSRSLAKVGLGFECNAITQVDSARWNAIALTPACPDIELVLTSAADERIITMKRTEHPVVPGTRHEEREQWRSTAAEHIRRFSQTRMKKEAIRAFRNRGPLRDGSSPLTVQADQ
jgi:hypothetical protein